MSTGLGGPRVARAAAPRPAPRRGETLGRWLSHRQWRLVAGAIGMALVLPSLGIGLQLDDHIHRHILTGTRLPVDLPRGRLDIFAFLDGDAARTARLIDLGLVPWWTLETVRVAFWRPLSALTHWVDYALWPARPVLMHVQSILWYGALVVAVAALYRRVLGAVWASGLAAVLYAVAGSHGFPAGWLANRNAVLGALGAVLALIAHDRWRRDRWRPGSVWGPALLLAALLSAEAAVAAWGYLLAHALFLDRAAPRARLAALLPAAAVTLAWQVLYRALGYGTAGAAPYYISPTSEPALFATAVAEQGPAVLMAQWILPIEYAGLLFASRGRLIATAVGVVAILALVFWPLVRASAAARFCALGHVLAAVPLCATYPHERHLVVLGIGATGLLAEFAAGLAARAPWAQRSAPWRVAAWGTAAVLLVVHALVAPVRLPFTSRGFERFDRALRESADSIPFDPARPDRTTVIVDAPDASAASFVHFYRLAAGQPLPARIYRLGPGFAPMELERPDAHTLVVRTAQGLFSRVERVFRGEGHPMAAGQRVRLTGITAEVRAVSADGRPTEVAFRFDAPLEDPSLDWLAWRRELGSVRYGPFDLPRIGERRRVP